MSDTHCYNLAMRKSSRLITQFYEDKLSAVGLKAGQFSILRAVFHLKETTNKALQSVLVLDQTTLTRNLKPLIRDGYLELLPHPDDGRLKQIRLTASGTELYEKALPIWQDAQTQLKEKLGEAETTKILEIADKFVKAFS